MEPGPLLEMFGDVSEAITRALAPVQGAERRARTARPGQYAIDVIADEAALSLILGHDLLIVSEESGVTGPPKAPVTVVIDPVDGSSNASRDLPVLGDEPVRARRPGPARRDGGEPRDRRRSRPPCAVVARSATTSRCTPRR